MDAAGEPVHVHEARERRVVDGDDQAIETVDGVVEQIDQLFGELDLAHAQLVEHVLEVVRELGDVAEAEHAGEAFERVHLAEDLVDELGADVLALRFELGEVARKSIEQFFRLARELLSCAIVFLSHAAYATFSSRRSFSTRSPASNGFTRYSSAPKAAA